MEGVLLLAFTCGLYSLIVYVSMKPFYSWFGYLFKGKPEVAAAAGNLAAMFWPIGWPVIVFVGLYHAGLMIATESWNALLVVINSCKVLFKHFTEAERGDQ